MKWHGAVFYKPFNVPHWEKVGGGGLGHHITKSDYWYMILIFDHHQLTQSKLHYEGLTDMLF